MSDSETGKRCDYCGEICFAAPAAHRTQDRFYRTKGLICLPCLPVWAARVERVERRLQARKRPE